MLRGLVFITSNIHKVSTTSSTSPASKISTCFNIISICDMLIASVIVPFTTIFSWLYHRDDLHHYNTLISSILWSTKPQKDERKEKYDVPLRFLPFFSYSLLSPLTCRNDVSWKRVCACGCDDMVVRKSYNV